MFRALASTASEKYAHDLGSTHTSARIVFELFFLSSSSVPFALWGNLIRGTDSSKTVQPTRTRAHTHTRTYHRHQARVEERVSELVDNDHYNIKMPYSSLRFDGPSHASFLRVGGEDGREPQDEIEEARRRAWKPASSPPKPLGQGNAAPLSAESATAPPM